MTARALGAEFDQLLLPELDAPPSSGRHRDDAARLLARIEQSGDAGSVPPWIVDLARYEMAFVAAARPGAVLILRVFRWPPRRLAAAAFSGADAGAPRRAIGLWLRLPGARPSVHRLFSATNTRARIGCRRVFIRGGRLPTNRRHGARQRRRPCVRRRGRGTPGSAPWRVPRWPPSAAPARPRASRGGR